VQLTMPQELVRQTPTLGPFMNQFAISAVGAITHLTVSAARTRATANVVVKAVKIEAESRLGVQAEIEDPAMRKLFDVVVHREQLLTMAREEAEALIKNAGTLAQGFVDIPTTTRSVGRGGKTTADDATSLAESLVQVVDKAQVDASGSCDDTNAAIIGKVTNALWHTLSKSRHAGAGDGSARYVLEQRLRREVCDPIDEQLSEHENLRSLFREQRRLREQVRQCCRQVTVAMKTQQSLTGTSSSRSSGSSSVGGDVHKSAAELEQTQTRIAALDAELLQKLLAIKDGSWSLVLRTWASLAFARGEFFQSLGASWNPVATALGSTSGSRAGNMQPAPPVLSRPLPGTPSSCAHSEDEVPFTLSILDEDETGSVVEPPEVCAAGGSPSDEQTDVLEHPSLDNEGGASPVHIEASHHRTLEGDVMDNTCDHNDVLHDASAVQIIGLQREAPQSSESSSSTDSSHVDTCPEDSRNVEQATGQSDAEESGVAPDNSTVRDGKLDVSGDRESAVNPVESEHILDKSEEQDVSNLTAAVGEGGKEDRVHQEDAADEKSSAQRPGAFKD